MISCPLQITNMRQPPRVCQRARKPVKPYFSPDLRPSNTLEGTSSTSDHAIPDEELPADSFSDYHPMQHTRDSQHESTASDTPDSPDTLYNIEQVLTRVRNKF